MAFNIDAFLEWLDEMGELCNENNEKCKTEAYKQLYRGRGEAFAEVKAKLEEIFRFIS